MRVHVGRAADEIVVQVPVTANERVKEVPGARFHPQDRTWRVPLSWAACVQLRGVFGDALDVAPALAEWATEEYETRVKPAMEARGC